ncbi:hypothetical protein N9L68_00030 [bacterium]|nr:hypothetical protein [bacterium]
MRMRKRKKKTKNKKTKKKKKKRRGRRRRIIRSAIIRLRRIRSTPATAPTISEEGRKLQIRVIISHRRVITHCVLKHKNPQSLVSESSP